jgi:DtxR family transcriptional regulator, Mn-dependent transcriptional regulator
MLKWLKKIRDTRHRVLVEDTLKHLHASDWRSVPATPDSLGGALGLSPRQVMRLCATMQTRGWLRIRDGRLHCTPAGEQLALEVIRAHRLWEKYLADEARVPLAEVHTIADRREHSRTDESMRELDALMGYPSTDPHGDPIPTAEGLLERPESVPLTEWPVDQPAMIVHLEDEPVAVFSQIAAERLRPGQRINVIESSGQRIVFTDDVETHVLAPVVAANVFVAPCEAAAEDQSIVRLTSLDPGESAVVHALDDTLRGYTRRRLLDLGLTAGAAITAEYRSFLGDPVAFRVRGSLIALRRDQAEHVLICANNGVSDRDRTSVNGLGNNHG